MVRLVYIFIVLVILTVNAYSQDSTRVSGQVSSWMNINNGNDLPLWGGVRYIPQLNYSMSLEAGGLYDAEVSANIFGSAAMNPFDSIRASGRIKPYRGWIRYSSDQFELRMGLQKINFGSASMIRPLMWFDQLDPRDPLQLTDGVWGALARYYFLDNSNIWLWGLFGNSDLRGWEKIPVNSSIPEFGGRVQLPLSSGEIAFSYHHRVADSRNIEGVGNFNKIPENKIGFDIKMDLKAGLWFEGSYTNKRRNVGVLTNQLILNAGIDYTFNVGSGLYLAYEQLLASYDVEAFSFLNPFTFSLISVNYPLGLFDRIGSIVYYDWTNNNVYAFLNWQKQFDNISFHVIAYRNPDLFQLPAQTDSQNIFAGRGIQLMFVFNH